VGANKYECVDAGGQWYQDLCYGDAPKLGCDDVCSDDPKENDCNEDCGGPDGIQNSDDEAWVNECGTCVSPDSNEAETCIQGTCDSDGDGENDWSDTGSCKKGECREAICLDFDLEYLGDPIELIDISPNNLQEACQDTGGVWYGTYGAVLERDNQDDCVNCTDINEDGTCDDDEEIIGIWYSEEGEKLDEYNNKPDCVQGAGTWVSFTPVEDDCGICGGTDHLGESGTFEDEDSSLYGQCSCKEIDVSIIWIISLKIHTNVYLFATALSI
jgi:hypothetical protein